MLGGCIAATMPSKAAGSAQTLLRIPVDVTAQALTDLLRILYSGISWALLDELLVASKERLSEVLAALLDNSGLQAKWTAHSLTNLIGPACSSL